MSLKPIGVGSDVEALCGRCKRETWHVVLAMVDGAIAKVQCKLCGAQHRFRRPGSAADSRRKASHRSAGSGGRSSRSRANKPPPEPPGPTVEADTKRPIRPYKASEQYDVGERVDHKTFGLGVVELTEPGKVTLWFPGGRKVLAQARETAKLSRPPPIRYDD